MQVDVKKTFFFNEKTGALKKNLKRNEERFGNLSENMKQANIHRIEMPREKGSRSVE